MTNVEKVNGWMSPRRDRVGGTYGGGREAPVSEVLSHVLQLLGSDALGRWTHQGIRDRRKAELSADPDLSYLQEKLGLSVELVLSMVRHYGRPTTLEALRQMEGRPPHPAYLAAVCRRLSEGRP